MPCAGAQAQSAFPVMRHRCNVLRPGDQIDRKINSTRTALADASRATVGTGPGPVPFG